MSLVDNSLDAAEAKKVELNQQVKTFVGKYCLATSPELPQQNKDVVRLTVRRNEI